MSIFPLRDKKEKEKTVNHSEKTQPTRKRERKESDQLRCPMFCVTVCEDVPRPYYMVRGETYTIGRNGL